MKELIELAKEKGFKSDFEKLPYPVGKNDSYLCMCELQKWLRDEYKIFVSIEVRDFETGEHWVSVGLVETVFFTEKLCESFDSYESALLEGLKQALKYI